VTEVRRTPSTRRPNRGGVVDAVEPGSLAEQIGLQPGDRITAIGGRELRDAVDFQFLAAEDLIEIDVVRGDESERVQIEKHPDEQLGIEFQDAAFDGVRTCNNSCFFCFLKGNPKGMRKTLYVKDDDYRLSFYHGNFVTLTNLTEDDWVRFEEQRLSPINVSVHATDPELRRYLLGNADAPDICAQLRRLGSIGIEANTQIVLCPGVNDGAALDRSVSDLAALWPTVRTISVVPVGATMTAEDRIGRGAHASEVDACTAEHARAVLEQMTPYQQRFRGAHGRGLVYAADEYYLAAGVEPPDADAYDGFEQYENGIGMTRWLLDEWAAAKRRPFDALPTVRRMTVVCASLIAPTLERIGAQLGALAGIEVRVRAIDNTFFGPRVNVSGLLVSADIQKQLKDEHLGDLVMLPRSALDYTGARFLDDGTPQALQEALAVPIAFATTMGEVLTIMRQPLESLVAGATQRSDKSNGKAWVDYAALAGGGARKAGRN